MRDLIAIAAAVLTVACLAGTALADVQTHIHGPYTRYELTLAKAVRVSRDVVLHLGASHGRFRHAWATVPGLEQIRGEVIRRRVLSYDKESVDFQSPFLHTRTLKSSHLKAIEFNVESRNTTDLAKLERLTVPRFNRDSSPSHILVGNNGDLKRGSLLTIKGQTVQFESKLRKFSVPIDRIARVVSVSKPPEEAARQSAETDSSSVRFKLADGSTLVFEPLKTRGGKLVGRSVIYGDVSIPIANLVELQLGDFERERFTPVFSDWVVRPSKEPQFGKTP
jgi:hypothetical protein